MSFLLRSIEQKAESPPKHIPMVRTVAEMARQISDCHVKRSDIVIEYSSYRNRTLDIKNMRQLLKDRGFEESDTLSSRHSYPVANPIKEQVAEILQLDCYKLQFLFRCLFPQHPLVDKNHSAAVDSIQLAQIVRLLVELAKQVKDRVLPPELLQGLDRLPFFEQKIPWRGIWSPLQVRGRIKRLRLASLFNAAHCCYAPPSSSLGLAAGLYLSGPGGQAKHAGCVTETTLHSRRVAKAIPHQ